MLAAEMRGAQTFIFQEMQKRIVRALAEAEKDNDFIYHAKIPEVSALSAIAKAVVAKSTPISSPLSSHFKGTLSILNIIYLAMVNTLCPIVERIKINTIHFSTTLGDIFAVEVFFHLVNHLSAIQDSKDLIWEVLCRPAHEQNAEVICG